MAQDLQYSKKQSIAIYNHDLFLKRTWTIIKRELSDQNVALLQKYDKAMVNSSLAKATRIKQLNMIISLSRILGKNWVDVTKEDIDELVFKVMERYSDENGKETNTTWDHKKVLKSFFRWVRLGSREKLEVGDPPETKDVKIRKVRSKIVRENLLTEDDRTKLLHACGENQRDRAFLDCHFEAGTRPGEILNLQIKHVKFDKYGAVIHVDGKTGPRHVRLIRSAPNLASWLDIHPFKDNLEAPLWPIFNHRSYGKPLDMASARSMLRIRAKKANLAKRVYLNLFRHSEATLTANFMTEAQLRKRHGWTETSHMPARYVHLIQADVDKAIFEHLGIKEKNELTDKNLPKICHVCSVPNSPEATICSKCGKPLDLKSALEMEERYNTERENDRKEINQLKLQQEKILLKKHTYRLTRKKFSQQS